MAKPAPEAAALSPGNSGSERRDALLIGRKVGLARYHRERRLAGSALGQAQGLISKARTQRPSPPKGIGVPSNHGLCAASAPGHISAYRQRRAPRTFSF